ncbi:MAG: hypothetical protein GX902_12405, partial [Lentisphaerae bacterium]|nr:hypothetical protein [Lentisphaerota bacterium]
MNTETPLPLAAQAAPVAAETTATPPEQSKSCCCRQLWQRFLGRAAGVDPAEEVPVWLLALLSLALLSMASQVKFPFAGGKIALADVTFAAAFLGLLWQSFRRQQSVFYPTLGLLAIIAAAVANSFSRPGISGAIELAQLVQQFFCGMLLFSYFLRHAPFAATVVVSLGLLLNVMAGLSQTVLFGYGSIQAPADVQALPWGFGKALTGFFRSRMAFSFFLAGALVWIQPQWLGRRTGFWRWLAVLLASILVLSFIAHGMMLVLCLAVLLTASCFLSKRAVLLNLLAAVVLVFSLAWGAENAQRSTVLATLNPVKTGDFAGELKTCHLDFLAALKMAGQVPWRGVGSSRYQDCIGRCYGELPNPSYNDIDADTQAGWGIIAGTLGFPAAALLVLLLLLALTGGLRRHLRGGKSDSDSVQALGGAAAVTLFTLGMFISDPLTRGLGWFLALALSAATLPAPGEVICACQQYSGKKIILTGVFLGLLLAPVVLRSRAEDPLRGMSAAVSRRPARLAPAQGSGASIALSDAEVFLVLNATQVQEFTPPFEKYQDSLAAEKTALRILDGKGVPPANEEPSMQYGGALFTFELPAAVAVKVWVRTWWDGSCGNTLNLKMDDEPRSVTIGNDGT